jgi:hypothetical protein
MLLLLCKMEGNGYPTVVIFSVKRLVALSLVQFYLFLSPLLQMMEVPVYY